MSLTPKQARALIEMIGMTRDEEELSCDHCLAELAHFVETELTGKPKSVVHERITEHLAACSDCCEEYEALKAAVESLDAHE